MNKKEGPANSTPRFIKNIIDRSERSELMEMFIIGALVHYAEAITSMTRKEIDESMAFGAEWHDCATEVLKKIDVRFPGRGKPTKDDVMH